MDIGPLKEAYWEIVTDCLVEFHGYARPAAEIAVVGLRDLVESPRSRDAAPAGYDSSSFFHAEPFYVACDVAGTGLDLEAYREGYDLVRKQRYAAAETEQRRSSEPSAVRYAGT